MKKSLNIIILLFALAVIFAGCKKDEKEPVLDTSETVSPAWVLQPAADTHFVLQADSADAVLTTLEWSHVVYNLSDIPTPLYTFQMFLAGSDTLNPWGDAIDLFTISENVKELTYDELNDAILKQIGVTFPADTVINAAFRIKANVNANDVASTIDSYSDYAAFKVTPYTAELSASVLYVPGDYQGWDPATAPNVYSAEGDGVYTGYIYYPEGGSFEFKFTSDPDWNHSNFGSGATDGTLDTDPTAGNLMVPEFGGYWLTCDTVGLTWEYEAQNWGVIGSGILGGDWSEDVDLIYDADNMVLSVTIDVSDAPAGEDLRFKFRANDGWDINLGQGDGENELSYGGPDIVLPDGAGNYTFVLNMFEQIPTYSFTKN